MQQITTLDLERMTRHWMRTPVNSYYGCDYGNDLPSVLLTPFSVAKANDQINKLKEDVPILGVLPPELVNIFSQHNGLDEQSIVISVAGSQFPL